MIVQRFNSAKCTRMCRFGGRNVKFVEQQSVFLTILPIYVLKTLTECDSSINVHFLLKTSSANDWGSSIVRNSPEDTVCNNQFQYQQCLFTYVYNHQVTISCQRPSPLSGLVCPEIVRILKLNYKKRIRQANLC